MATLPWGSEVLAHLFSGFALAFVALSLSVTSMANDVRTPLSVILGETNAINAKPLAVNTHVGTRGPG